MLTRLFIQNLATVDKQIIEFTPGFSVLTGETGAGKSIIIKAVNLILGEKCPKDLIRAGEDFLSVEASFSIRDNQSVKTLLDDMEIEHDDELTVRRKVNISGKNSIFINDHSSKLKRLSVLGEWLIDLHGQHAQQFLLRPATHVDYLDQFANLKDTVQQFQDLYRLLRQKQQEKEALEQSAAERARNIDFIQFQIEEIEKAGFTAEEVTQLDEELRVLTYGEQIVETLTPIAQWHTVEQSPLNSISATLGPLESLLKVAPDLKELAAEIKSGLISLQEAAAGIDQYLNNLDIDPNRLEAVNERLAELDRLKRKYGQTLDDIDSFKVEQARKLTNLEKQDINYLELENEIVGLIEQVAERGAEISDLRRSKKPEFEQLVLSALNELGLERSLFEVEITQLPKTADGEQTYNMKGLDQVAFLITTNPGNPLKPLAKVASGGELSRVMLAIKTTLSEDISQGTMIFDEIDSGISGRVAETVGFKLVKLGQNRQVVCITHSPQIASRADAHFRVEKQFSGDSSTTLVSPLADDERIEEIARFLGGNKISEKTLSAAREMLSIKPE